jgi:hypothetical protein
MKKIVITLMVCALIAIQSCYTSKPTGYAGSPDYNKRVEVINAGMKKKGNGMNVVFTVSLAGAGGFAGYQYLPLVQKQTATGQESVRAANAAVGALSGVALAYLCNAIAGKNKVTPVVDPQQWIKKANPQYRLLSGANRNFTVIHSSVERNFAVKNLQDVRDFKKMFPQSHYKNDMLLSGIANLRREYLPELIALYPAEEATEQVKIKYITSSSTFSEAVEAIQRYSNVDYDSESYLLTLIRNVDHSVKFLELYPNTNYRKTAILYAFTSSSQSKKDWDRLYNIYKKDIFLNAGDFADNISDNIKENYYHAMYALHEVNTLYKFNRFNAKYIWLKYPDKKKYILSTYWDMVDETYSSGMTVIDEFKNILIQPIYADLKITETDIKDVMTTKLNEEVSNKVFIQSRHALGSHNKEWEEWKQSDYTAGLVSDYGSIQYILYGEVENTSKFDVPVEITGAGVLAKTVRLDGQGKMMQNAVAFLKFLGAQTEQTETIAGTTESCLYPAIPSGGKILYAVLLDFGEGIRKSGINVLDAMKVSSELSLKQHHVGIKFSSTIPSQTRMQKQNEWLQFAHNGLPSSTLVDCFRNEEVRQELWDVKYKERQRSLAEYREQCDDCDDCAECDWCDECADYYIIDSETQKKNMQKFLEYDYEADIMNEIWHKLDKSNK